MINNRDDVNKYYQLINELIDDYIDRWKIRPSNLKRYLQPGSERFNKFLIKNGLKEVKGSDRVLKDVIEDRDAMERDGVLTFENFKFFESDQFNISSIIQSIYKGIDKTSIDHEKALADRFDTSIGHIDIINPNTHEFIVKDWENGKNVIVYKKDEIDIVKENIKEFCLNQLMSESIKVIDLVNINLKDIIDLDKYKKNIDIILNQDENIFKIISNCLNDYDFDKEFNGFYIWIKKH